MKDELTYIKKLIKEGEHQLLDFKFEITNAKKIAKTLVAFANTDGGRLLIGVKDNGRISGIRTEEEYYMIDAAASMYCKPEIPFTCYRRIIEGKTIIEIVIEASDKRPHYAKDENGKWLAYHRVLDNNFLADYILLQVWKRKKREKGTYLEYSEHEKLLLKYLEENGKSTLETIKTSLPYRKKELQQMLINLISIEVVTMEFQENVGYFESNC